MNLCGRLVVEKMIERGFRLGAPGMVCVMSCLIPAAAVSAQNSVVGFSGRLASSDYGIAIDSVGDMTGDGIEDLLIGAPGDSATGFGAVVVESGVVGQADFRYEQSLQLDTGFGAAVAGGFDLNGDGVKEIVIGEPRSPIYGFDTGRIVVIDGSSLTSSPPYGGVELGDASGRSNSEEFGTTIEMVRDVTGDGVADIVVGSPLGASGRGRVALVDGAAVASGATGSSVIVWTRTGTLLTDRDGTSLAIIEDVDGDGSPEVVIGGNGVVRVRSAATGDLVPYFFNLGVSENEFFGGFGAAMSADGDFTGDGVNDLLISAPTAGNGGLSGWAYLYDGVNGNIVDSFLTNIADFGLEVLLGTDVNFDGAADIFVIGSEPSGNSTIYRYDAAADAFFLFRSESVTTGQLGPMRITDLNGDGRRELTFTRPNANTNAGRVQAQGFGRFILQYTPGSFLSETDPSAYTYRNTFMIKDNINLPFTFDTIVIDKAFGLTNGDLVWSSPSFGGFAQNTAFDLFDGEIAGFVNPLYLTLRRGVVSARMDVAVNGDPSGRTQFFIDTEGPGPVRKIGQDRVDVTGTINTPKLVVNDGVLDFRIGSSLEAENVTVNGGRFVYRHEPTIPAMRIGDLVVDGGVVEGDLFAEGLAVGPVGTVRSRPSDTMRLGGIGRASVNDGLLEVIGGPGGLGRVTFDGSLSVSGAVVLRDGELSVREGTVNDGSFAIPFGRGEIIGDFVNTANGLIQVTGGGQVTLYDDLTNDGTIVVSSLGPAPASVVTLGALSGSGQVLGGGTVIALGDLRPGSSPGRVFIDGSLVLGPLSRTEFEIDGLAPGVADRIELSGDFGPAGTVEILPGQGVEFPLNVELVLVDVGGVRVGRFYNAAEGDRIDFANGTFAVLTYEGGDGNDVSLVGQPSFKVDLNADGADDFLDVIAYLGGYDAGESTADISDPQGLTSVDVRLFLAALSGSP